ATPPTFEPPNSPISPAPTRQIVPRISDRQPPAPACQHTVKKTYEPILPRAGCNRRIQPGADSRRQFVPGSQRPERRLHVRHQECGGHPLARNVADAHRNRVGIETQHVVVVPSHGSCRLPRRRYGVALQLWDRIGNEPLLNRSRVGKLLLTLCAQLLRVSRGAPFFYMTPKHRDELVILPGLQNKIGYPASQSLNGD